MGGLCPTGEERLQSESDVKEDQPEPIKETEPKKEVDPDAGGKKEEEIVKKETAEGGEDKGDDN